jgi:translation initiation factor IF-1
MVFVPSTSVSWNEALLESCSTPEMADRLSLSGRCGSQCFSFMPVEDVIEIEGEIVAVLPGTMFRVQLTNKHLVLAHISGRMRKRWIRLTMGDRVKLEMSPYDLDKARIVYRLG